MNQKAPQRCAETHVGVNGVNSRGDLGRDADNKNKQKVLDRVWNMCIIKTQTSCKCKGMQMRFDCVFVFAREARKRECVYEDLTSTSIPIGQRHIWRGTKGVLYQELERGVCSAYFCSSYIILELEE